MLTFEQKLKNLATLALRVGVNLQPGQRLILTGPLEAADLMREITRQAYELGAPLVRANYNDTKQELIRALHAHEDTLDEVDLEKLGMNRTSKERGDAPVGLSGADPSPQAEAAAARLTRISRAALTVRL